MHGISYTPTDLPLLKGFSKNFSFEDFPNFQEISVPRLDHSSTANLSWKYHQIVSIENCAKHFFKYELTFVLGILISLLTHYSPLIQLPFLAQKKSGLEKYSAHAENSKIFFIS